MRYLNWFVMTCSFLMGACSSPAAGHRLMGPSSPLIRDDVQNQPVKQAIPVPAVPRALYGKPKSRILIMVDAGHGGKDLGTHSLKPPAYQEKYLALATAGMLRNYLLQLGYDVVMTRVDDVFLTLEKRAELANDRMPQAFVSVHYNSAPNKEAEGIEVYYYQSNDNKKRSAESKQLAQSVLNQVVQSTAAKSRGVKHGNFAVIRETHMPAILIEGGFLTNAQEGEKLRNAVYLKHIAWGIARGLQDYLKRDLLLIKQ